MERIPESSPLFPYISCDSERMSGQPVFRGTRVLIRSLFDYLKGGESLDVFLDDFEGVTREQAEGVIELAAQGMLKNLDTLRAA
jgi:uncharacterized protein (DUF433 family)